ncbi:class I SAM-dependent methyltransferase [Candidatus Poribacteria bacterium]|nr:class I SAM-dependent methyltransferase [Candidatus Poribacteria bacterium]MYB02167.1 class I SAM-dependent methyltransferase [Candidatus Poribacteria bacterium]
MGFHYKNIVPWGRSFDEYLDMFNLSEDDLARDIVDVGGGPASFNTGMHQRGTPIISVDPIYRYSEVELRQRIQETHKDIITQAFGNRDKFVWTKFASVDELAEVRRQAMDEFCQDFEGGKQQGRYIDASLPNLPFPDRHFDLVLSAHLLFFYSANRDLAFHLDAVRELLRIGTEVRIFPIVDVNSSPSPFLSPVIDELEKDGIACSVERVPYHFQKTGNEMLRLKPC